MNKRLEIKVFVKVKRNSDIEFYQLMKRSSDFIFPVVLSSFAPLGRHASMNTYLQL